MLNGFFHNALTGRRAARTAIDAVATRGGKWAGYSVTAMPGTMEFLFDDLAPATPRVLATEFMRLGKGSATVTVPDAKGKPVNYRLEMSENGWRITEILAGRPLHR